MFELGGISEKGCPERLVGFGLVLVTWGGFEGAGLCSDGTLSGRGAVPWLVTLAVLSVERADPSKAQGVTGREAAVTHIIREGGGFGIYGLDNVHVLFVFTHLPWSCFCLDPSRPQSSLV